MVVLLPRCGSSGSLTTLASLLTTALLLASPAPAHAWLPHDGSKTIVGRDGISLFGDGSAPQPRTLPSALGKLRGVNLGSQFIVEPWMMSGEWSGTMGCSGAVSEWDCVKALGQQAADKKFAAHWASWINETDFNQMVQYGLNTVRVPVGYWMKEDLVRSGEYFPKGGLQALLKLCGWAADRGIFVILDHHGAPGAQATSNAFTGHSTPTPGFYTTDNYNRGAEFLGWLTNLTHTRNELRTVGMIAVLNEPLNWNNRVDSLTTQFYPMAYKAVRDAESRLGKTASAPLHVQFMSATWGAGAPTAHLPANYSDVAAEDHRYIKWDTSVQVTHDAYLRAACKGSASKEPAAFVTEWSLSVPDNVENSADWSKDGQKDFYKKFFAAQMKGFEKTTGGWTFWSWKTTLGDYRWTYKDGVAAGIIPKNLSSLDTSNVCDGFN